VQNSISEVPAELAEALDLGVALGQNQTFGLVAGRCSAAQAESLRRLRDEKKYQRVVPTWKDFCSRYLNMSGTQADRIIRLLEEFGPTYFELSQLTRISPETYRAIEPSVKDGALHCNGETIELDPENAQKVAAAVAELRSALPPRKPPKPPEMHERIGELDERCSKILVDFEEISDKERAGENWLAFTAVLARMSAALKRLELENGLV
jgi:hypothetical protein